MTDNTQLTDNIDQTLHEVEKTLVSVRTVNQETFTDIQNKLWEVYEKATNAGDATAAKTVEQAWIQVQQMNNAAISSADAAQTIADLARELQQQRQQALTELSELTEAIDVIDMDHPAVSRLAEIVEENTREYLADMEGDMYEESYSEGRSSVYEDVHWSLKRTGLSSGAIEAFTELFDGSMDLSPAHVELVKEFVNRLIAIRPVSDKFGPGPDDDWDDEDEDGDDDDDE